MKYKPLKGRQFRKSNVLDCNFVNLISSFLRKLLVVFRLLTSMTIIERETYHV